MGLGKAPVDPCAVSADRASCLDLDEASKLDWTSSEILCVLHTDYSCIRIMTG